MKYKMREVAKVACSVRSEARALIRRRGCSETTLIKRPEEEEKDGEKEKEEDNRKKKKKKRKGKRRGRGRGG